MSDDVWRPGDYAWIEIRQGRAPVVMQRGSQRQWFLPGSERPYYAGDIWDIVGPVAEPPALPVERAAGTEK